MTEGVIWKSLLRFTIPMAIGLLFQQLYNTVDSIVVGQFVGKEALAAVGSTTSIVNMLVGFCMGLSTGATVIISQSYGAHDHKKLHDAVHTTMVITFIMGIAATFIGLFAVKPMLRMMKTPADVFGEADAYLTIYFAGISGLLVYNMGAGILRAVGDSRRPLYYLIFSAVVNVVLDLVFVIKFNMGVAGVAYATIIAQFMSSALVLYSLTRTDQPYGIKWRNLGIRKDMLKNILDLGLPAGVQQAITSFSNVFVQSYINAFGSACMAGWTSYNKLDAYVLIPMQAIAMASTTFVGQNYGAGRLDRARKGAQQALGMSMIITALLSVAVIVFSRSLLRLFTPDQEVIEYGARFIALISPFYITTCFNQIYAGALRGIGQSKILMVIMLFSFVVFRQLYLLINGFFGGNFTMIALAYPAGWVLCSILMAIVYQRSPLSKRNVKAAMAEE